MNAFKIAGASARRGRIANDAGQSSSSDLPFPSNALRQEPIGVAIVDGNEDARRFLKWILEQSDEFSCVGSYASGEEALDEIPLLLPGVVLMEVRMQGISGIECTRRLKCLLPGLVVVLVSGVVDLGTMLEARQAGGDRWLAKPFTMAQCLAELRFAVGHDASAAIYSAEVDRSRGGGPERIRLTKREKEVMRCLAKGLLYKEIADELGISFSAVNKHQHNIFRKLQVNNAREAINKWRDSQYA